MDSWLKVVRLRTENVVRHTQTPEISEIFAVYSGNTFFKIAY